MNDQEFFSNLEKFAYTLSKEHPDILEIAQEVWAKRLDPREGIRKIMLLSAEDQDLHTRLENELLSSFGYDPEETALATLPDREKMLDRWGFTEEDLIFQPDPERETYMLHPLLQGMICELLQFDGDLPELRTGPLPEGGHPAVPVKTTARNPVMIGALLRTAREEVAEALSIAQAEHDQKLQALAEAAGGTDSTAISTRIRGEMQKGASIEGYGPGKKAAMRVVEKPTTGDMAEYTATEKQKLAHDAVASTQGRRSIVPVIAGMIQDDLRKGGMNQVIIDDEGSEVIARAEWSMLIDGGASVNNPNFNYVDIAARSLIRSLRSEFSGKISRYTSVKLNVRPLNAVDERKVGWTATLSR